MKRSIVILALLSIFGLTFAKQVDPNTAKKVGQVFLTTNTNFKSVKSSSDLQLVYIVNSNLKTSFSTKSSSTATYFYVFNVVTTKGFVIVAGDDNVTPVLAYSDETDFDPNNIPQNTAKWLEGYKAQMRYIIENKIEATDELKNEWQNLLKGKGSVKSSTSVNPLIQTKWNQSQYYNDLCPFDTQNNERTVTGCVATAMAQIMKFWNYPENGTGFHSYSHSIYGTLSANFGSTTYQWNSMPNAVLSTNNAVATLMYHCGVSIDMNYNIASQGGSSVNTLDVVASALKTYFGYASSVQGINRSSYTTDNQWGNLLKAELDAGRPVQYAGIGTGGGHSFVCDGYDNNDLFHFNWGWGGNSDAYFSVNALNPGSLGIGGGNGGFNLYQNVIIGIQPPTGVQSFDLRLYNYVTPSASTINYGQPFTVTTNIINFGTNTFNGDYCVAIFDNSNTFFGYVETKPGFSLQGGYRYSSDLVFSYSGSFSMLPGTYRVGLFYRPTGGNWINVANNGSYTNFVQLTVIYSNDIELNSSMTVTPVTSLTNGQSASVNLNIVNDGTTTFTGQYRVALFNLDGTWAQTFNTLSESRGLPSGYTYLSPYLTFSTSSVSVNSGTYLLAVQHRLTSGNWQLTGSTYYLNPIKVIVKEAPLLPDIYEANNTINQSYTLPVSFSDNTSATNTTGSNCHIGSDYDFYMIFLSSGYDYSISARLHDSNNSGNGNTYTLDALFSYSTDGTTWSDAYDDIMSGNILLNNGGTVKFLVAPYFSGETGTYLLDLNITRSLITGVEKNDVEESVKVYPNPAKDYLIINTGNYSEKQDHSIKIVNQLGTTVYETKVTQPIYEINLSSWSGKGVYILQVFDSNNILKTVKKIILQ